MKKAKKGKIKAKKQPKKQRKAKRTKVVETIQKVVSVTKTKTKGKRRRAIAQKAGQVYRKFKSFAKKESVQTIAMNGAIIGAGAVGGAFLASKLPATIDKRIKALIPLAGGIGLHIMVKNEMAHKLSYGLMASGVLLLAAQFMPTMNLLSGEEVVYIPELPDTASGRAMLGYNPDTDDLMGIPEEFAEDEEYMGAVEDFSADWVPKD